MLIFYSNPYSVSKNFGGAINEFCTLMPDDCWIVIQDGDITYLTTDWGARIAASLETNGDKFGLIGCFTNRLAVKGQLHNGLFSEDHNILNHIPIAKSYSSFEITEVHHPIAGLFMAFKKSTWTKLKGFKENTYSFDVDFSVRVRSAGMKIGLMKGLYIYHQYRPLSKNPKTDIRHLR